MSAKFGPAGSSESFSRMGYKNMLDVPEYLHHFGLDHYEYQCGHGVRIREESAKAFGNVCREGGISLSLHAPYYISLSGREEKTRLNSIGYILQAARAAKAMGAGRIVVHSGSCSKMTREEALGLAKDTLKRALDAMDEEGLGDVTVCPETMGKVNQLGNLEEVMELCRLDERLVPCIDFGHLNARTFGAVREQGYEAILDTILDRLGEERLRCFHAHFSKIAYTPSGGEKAHLTFEDDTFGPDYEPLMELLFQRKLSPVIICESAGTQAEDAKAMKEYYQGLSG